MNGGTYNGTAILQSATVAAMVGPQVSDLDPNQGLIWYHQRIGGHDMVGHNGGDDGVSTDMFYEPSTGIGIIVLANQDDGADTMLKRILRYAPRL